MEGEDEFTGPWSSIVEEHEGSYHLKCQDVVFVTCQNNRDSSLRAITKYVRQLGIYKPSSICTKALHDWAVSTCQLKE